MNYRIRAELANLLNSNLMEYKRLLANADKHEFNHVEKNFLKLVVKTLEKVKDVLDKYR